MRKISDRDAQREARKLFEEEKITEFLEFILVYADSVETTDEKTKEVKRQENCITISITTKTDCYRIKSRDGRYQNQEKESYTKYGCAGISKLHGHYHEDETPPDEMVCERSK